MTEHTQGSAHPVRRWLSRAIHAFIERAYVFLRWLLSHDLERQQIGAIEVRATPPQLKLFVESLELLKLYSLEELNLVEDHVRYITVGTGPDTTLVGNSSRDMFVNPNKQGRDVFRTAALLLLLASMQQYGRTYGQPLIRRWRADQREHVAQHGLARVLPFLDWYASQFETPQDYRVAESNWLKQQADRALNPKGK